MSLKKTIATSILAAGVSLPLFAHAVELTVVNNTGFDSTSRINSGLCSTTVLGKDGVTPKHSTKKVSNMQLRLACIGHYDNCKADVYMTNNCTGDVITSVNFSLSRGILGHTAVKPGFKLTASGFQIQLDEVSK